MFFGRSIQFGRLAFITFLVLLANLLFCSTRKALSASWRIALAHFAKHSNWQPKVYLTAFCRQANHCICWCDFFAL